MLALPAPLRALVLSIPIQLLGACLALFAQNYLGIIAALALWALLAYALARLLSLPLAWQLLNLLLGPVALLSVFANLSPHYFAVAALVAGLVFLPTLWTRVPYYPSRAEMYELVAQKLPVEHAFNFIDLGSGFGGMLRYLATRFPNGHFVGLELAALPYLMSRLRASKYRNLEIRCQNFWNITLAEYDFIYAFLAPPPMPRLYEKFLAEAKVSSSCLINSFPLPGKPQEIIELDDSHSSRRPQVLFVYRRDKQTGGEH